MSCRTKFATPLEWELEQNISTKYMFNQPVSVIPNLQIVMVHIKQENSERSQ
jgi:hypothetical protein